ncbi:MAG: HD domain-containing protein [Erysipelotrichaceae bacterium]|nr:HD domain-containing protein [Erysipelotrichaceae bacterium]
MLNHELIKKTEEFLKQKFDHATEFEQEDIAYRLEHTYRVANIGRQIALKEGFDETEMVIACLLHDISYCEAEGENRFWPKWKDHGRRSASISRPFLEELGMEKDRIEDICYGIAIHVDEKADFPGENTPFALSIGDADNIDRFDVYRIHEKLKNDAFLDMSYEEKAEYLEKRIIRLRELKGFPTATKTAEEIWRARLDFYILFLEKMADQLKCSKNIIDE